MATKLNITVCEKEKTKTFITKMISELNELEKPIYIENEFPKTYYYNNRKYIKSEVGGCNWSWKGSNKVIGGGLSYVYSDDEFQIERSFSKEFMQTEKHTTFLGKEYETHTGGIETDNKIIAEVNLTTKTIVCMVEKEFPLLKQIAEKYEFKNLVKCWSGVE